ncbi:MAG: heme-binding protein, partial [Planctomycetota bacterium]|nr:heme-binding protein [Planctomycetota bacterium]
AAGITDGPTAAKLFGINVITTSVNKVSIDLPRRGTLLGDIKDTWRRSPNQAEDPSNINATRDFRQVIASNALDLGDVSTIIRNAADTALNQRAGVRRPLGLNAVVHITVCDQNGVNLGSFAMEDATVFSYDVAFQKGRGCAFFSDNRVAWAARSIGWVAQPHFPPGIDTTAPGPCFSIQGAYNPLGNILHPALNGFQVFPGGLPIYHNGELVGAIGISGDGVDQDDQISFGGTAQPFGTPGFVRVDVVDDASKVASLTRSLTKMLGATNAAINTLNAQAPLNASQQGTLTSLLTLQQLLNDKLQELKNPNRLTNVPIPWFKFARAPLLSETD